MADDSRAGVLAQRLAAGLCLTGAGLFGLAAIIVSRLDRVPGSSLYSLPGGRALDPLALTVLVICAGALALLGVTAFLLVPRRLPLVRPGIRSRRRPVLVLLLGAAMLVAVLAARRFGF